jgi:molecular chaperone HtpG
MKEMSQSGGGGMDGKHAGDVYNLVVNTNSPLATTILNNTDSQEHLEKA